MDVMGGWFSFSGLQNLIALRKGVAMRKCLKQVVCGCVCSEGRVVLITSLGVHCGWYHSLGLGAGLCENEECGLRNKHICIHLSALDCGCDGTWYFKFLSPRLPSMIDCDLAL